MKTRTYYLHQALHNSNVYTRVAAYQFAMGKSISDTMLFMMETFSLSIEETRRVIP
jgi:hypothetical protein